MNNPLQHSMVIAMVTLTLFAAAVQPALALDNGLVEIYQQKKPASGLPEGAPREVPELYEPITWDNVYTYDLTQPSDLTNLQLTGELSGLEDDLALAQENGVNGLFLLAVIKLESASGTSRLARESNNLGGITDGASGYRRFANKSECVAYMAELLASKYLNPDGKYYHGRTVADVNRAYCTTDTWTDKICAIMVNLQEQLADAGAGS